MSATFDFWLADVDRLLAKEGLGVTHRAFAAADLEVSYEAGDTPMRFVLAAKAGTHPTRDPTLDPRFAAWVDEVDRIRPYMRPDLMPFDVTDAMKAAAFANGATPAIFLQGVPRAGPPTPYAPPTQSGPLVQAAPRDWLISLTWFGFAVRFVLGMAAAAAPNPALFAVCLMLDLATFVSAIVLVSSPHPKEKSSGGILLVIWVLGFCIGLVIGYAATASPRY